MISTITLKVFERMHDRRIAGIVAEMGGDVVSERTVRNWLGRHTTPDAGRLEELLAKGRATVSRNLEGGAWRPEEKHAFLEGMDACPGFVSNLAFTLQNGSGLYPEFLQLATRIDLLEQQLAQHRANDDIQGWAQALLDAEWICDEQLEDPDIGTNAAVTRSQLREAQSWEDLERPTLVFTMNTLFQLLATLDLEFGATYLADWEATPFFAALLPRLNPRVDLAGKTTIRTTRNLYHYPARRLLDATACMRMMRESPARKWPRRIPAAGKMVEWLQLRGCGDLASNVAKWRGGRPLSAARFTELWDACFEFGPEADRPSAPMPMLFAATLFTELYIQGSLAKHDLTFVSPDPAFYHHWWSIQRRALENRSAPPRFGTKRWMPALAA
jgi:hypothetical protein